MFDKKTEDEWQVNEDISCTDGCCETREHSRPETGANIFYFYKLASLDRWKDNLVVSKNWKHALAGVTHQQVDIIYNAVLE